MSYLTVIYAWGTRWDGTSSEKLAKSGAIESCLLTETNSNE